LDEREFFVHQERDGKKRSVNIRPLIEKMDVKKRKENSGKGLHGEWNWFFESNGKNRKTDRDYRSRIRFGPGASAQCKVIKLNEFRESHRG